MLKSFYSAVRTLAAPARVIALLMVVLSVSRIATMVWYWDRV